MIQIDKLKADVKGAAEHVDDLEAELERGVEEAEEEAIQTQLDDVERLIHDEFKPQVEMVEERQSELQNIHELLVQAIHITETQGFNQEAFSSAVEGIQGMISIAEDTEPHSADLDGLRAWEMALAQQLSDHTEPRQVKEGLQKLLLQWESLARAYNAEAGQTATPFTSPTIPHTTPTHPPNTEPIKSAPEPPSTNPVEEWAEELLPRVQEAIAKLETAKDQLSGLPELLTKVEEKIELLKNSEESLRLYLAGTPLDLESTKNALTQIEEVRLPDTVLLLSEIESALAKPQLTPEQHQQLESGNVLHKVGLLRKSYIALKDLANTFDQSNHEAAQERDWAIHKMDLLQELIANPNTPEAFDALMRYSTGKEYLEVEIQQRIARLQAASG
ncbi:MAG: hypothetical protein QF486_04425 [Candidatus Woesearchaeota archaeon]|jgi:hypothetical protein|nr:hypothetical protein [Candidatus Woesearchaeota archaeon]MDP7198835.1 hypothetical protein [Candidatus Woesearchaeota archaeon]MDP7467165.1 hypothetical protein [Candidatus Woesearchaeota archaeon]MDP7647500.1 hypothetical protein [Candidatus Woesearchaeota archaeon]